MILSKSDHLRIPDVCGVITAYYVITAY